MPTENNGRKHEDRYLEVVPSRLDLKTRICLMAAIIYGTADPGTLEAKEAVDKAAEIENAADRKVRQMKQENPVEKKRWR